MVDRKMVVYSSGKPAPPTARTGGVSSAHVAAAMAHFFGGVAARGRGRPQAPKGGAAGRRDRGRRKAVGDASGAVRQQPLNTLKDLASQAYAEKKGGFLSVVADEKGQLSTAGAEKGMAREYARTLLGSKPFRVIVVQEIANVSVGNNTAMAVSSPMNFVSATEYSSWAALFDEVRCLSYKVRQQISVSMGSTPTVGACWAGAISPAINTAPSTLVQTLGFTRFVGPIPAYGNTAWPGASTPVSSSVQPVSNHGLPELSSGALARGVLPNNSGGTLTVNPVQGDWVPTGTNSAHAGYHLLFGDAPGTTVSWNYRLWIWYNLEFRSRSG